MLMNVTSGVSTHLFLFAFSKIMKKGFYGLDFVSVSIKAKCHFLLWKHILQIKDDKTRYHITLLLLFLLWFEKNGCVCVCECQLSVLLC